MAKKTRAMEAAAGTKLDPNRDVSELDRVQKALKPKESKLAPGMNSKREQLTRRMFATVEVVLVVIPFALLAMSGTLNMGVAAVDNLQTFMKEDPAFAISFITACLQCFVAYLLRLGYRHYSEGDAGALGGNLVVLLCAEMLMTNYVGIAGIALLLWRTWRRVTDQLRDWTGERGAGGALADVSGSLVVLAFAAICFFAGAQIQ